MLFVDVIHISVILIAYDEPLYTSSDPVSHPPEAASEQEFTHVLAKMYTF